ncbi:MAG TPA: hypothetical protein PKD51_19345 [Saprospiraceae bacterium]|nr:hypothetical protein [Saprospiraceae bacterium]HMU04278.1 hypothetical protein [Saprospiraceae bacterium]
MKNYHILFCLVFILNCNNVDHKPRLLSAWKLLGSKEVLDSNYFELYFYDNDTMQIINDFHYVKSKYKLSVDSLIYDQYRFFIRRNENNEIELFQEDKEMLTFKEYSLEAICHSSYTWSRIMHFNDTIKNLYIEEEIPVDIHQ